ncbi:receiver/sensor box histidine kinase [Haloarcula salina]|uniref:histidine kinase n=1 Tax=Haloarcula salina TaxID=1429914 RepID=A0AA41G5B2_9EURY|nr:ATP-binding protein [Haloarcula salina]MBV0903889.1 PAS domain-containing protein [Haloarcula salina]
MNEYAEPIHVLQVDDDPIIDADVATDAATPLSVTTVESGARALDRLDSERFDCLAVAADPPEVDCLSLVDAARESDDALPIVLVTDDVSAPVVDDAVERGVTDYYERDPEADRAGPLAKRVRLVTERQRAERRAERIRRRFDDLTEHTSVMLWVFAGDWSELLFVNSVYEDLYGRPVDALEENPMEFMTAIHPADQERVAEAIQGVSAGESVAAEFRITRPDDDQRWVRAEAEPVLENGSVARVVGYSRDITERKRRERRLEAFANVVSHDLRGPLDVARGQLELARSTGGEEHFEAVERAHRRIETLVEDLLALAAGGDAALDLEAVPLGTVAEQCWQDTDAEGATLDLAADAVFLADPERLRQLLANLVGNAVAHGPVARADGRAEGVTLDGTDLTVTVGELDDGFYVADDGTGIPADERERVFEPGYGSADGSGYGLCIVEQIAEAHGWSVDVCESEGGGARFEVTGVEPVSD